MRQLKRMPTHSASTAPATARPSMPDHDHWALYRTLAAVHPDNTTPGTAWLLLARCPGCGAEIPVAHVAGLADYLDVGSDLGPIAEVRDDSLHAPGCTFAPSSVEDPSGPPWSARSPHARGGHRVTT